MEDKKLSLLFVCVFYLAAVPPLRADIANFDNVWQKRSLEAKQAANHAFKPNPEEVTVDFNKHVNEALDGSNSTRRGLSKYNGPCTATNPIDSCWRCDPNWEKNRKRLADCVLGFGHGTTGGKDGKFYVVNDPSDNDLVNPKPGTLRHAVIQKEPLWIIFAHDMVIRLNAELLVTSNKTIDGRGALVHISGGAQITLQYVKNVIIHGLHVRDIKKGGGGLIRDSVDHYGYRSISDGDGISLFGATNVWIDHISLSNCDDGLIDAVEGSTAITISLSISDGDGISLFGATNVWIDHISLSNCDDGLIDAVEGSTAITISNCHMTHHNDVMLFGASDSYSGDQVMQITLAFNHFGQGLVQRMPRCRWGFFHVVNNDYTRWLMYAIGGSQHPTIISQGNRFIAPINPNAKEVTKRDYAPESVWRTWNWRSEGDLMMNGAFFVESGNKVANPPDKDIKAKPGTMAASLTRFAGALRCVVNKPC